MGARAIVDDGTEWLGRRSKAVALIASDSMTSEEVCKEVGISQTTYHRWLRHRPFANRVEIARREIAQRAMNTGVALKAERIAKANKRWQKLHKVIEARATAAQADLEAGKDVAPGAETGMMAHTLKGVGAGPAAQVVDEWEVDTGLLAEIRAHELQVAKELGQIEDKSSIRLSGNPDEWPDELKQKYWEHMRNVAFGNDEQAAKQFEAQALLEAGQTVDTTCETVDSKTEECSTNSTVQNDEDTQKS